MTASKLFSKIHNPAPACPRPVLAFGGCPGKYNEVQKNRTRVVLSGTDSSGISGSAWPGSGAHLSLYDCGGY